LFARTLAHRLSEFAHFLGQPGHGGRNATSAVTFAVGAFDDVLQLGDVHAGSVSKSLQDDERLQRLPDFGMMIELIALAGRTLEGFTTLTHRALKPRTASLANQDFTIVIALRTSIDSLGSD
jgi:hypothetical protein